MSGIVGKNSKSLTKQNVTESKLAQQGVTNLRMLHKATAGDTSINLGALSAPSEAVSFEGNPSPAVVLSSIISQQKNNIRIFSTLNGELMQNITWIISGSSVNFVNSYAAEDGEIFEIVINNRIVNGNTVVDARQLGASGTLAAAQTIFNVGEAYEVGKNIGAQIGAIMVFKDGLLQHRKVGNVASGEGNYIEVPTVTNGQYGNTIQFDQAEGVDTSIQVVSVGLLAEKPNVSQMQAIETLAGQIDKLVPTVAQLAGVPETDFQSAPNNIDLKSFGDRVLSLETTKQNTIAIKYQEKVLAANATGAVAGTSLIQFNNLVVGKWYEITGMVYAALSTTDDAVTVLLKNGASTITMVSADSNGAAGGEGYSLFLTPILFQATATTFVMENNFSANINTYIAGTNSKTATWMGIKELPDGIYSTTTDFT